jgi:pyruvate dehydrogenase E1 component alpha subunit
MEKIDKDKMLEMYEKMLLIRKFEEKVEQFFAMGKVHGTTHLYIGEEATAAGVCCAAEPEDMIASTHRGHGHCIAKGIDINLMMAELLGKEVGYCKGKGGSMHIADLEQGNLGANGVVGGGIPLAVGAGITTKMKKIDRIVVCFFGDGATNQGTFHESLNLASIWKLPVLFVCEDNKYGMSMSRYISMNVEDIAVRASSYGIPGKTIDGNDAVAIYEETRSAHEYVRKNGPMLLVCNTYRYLGHSKSDANVYRTKNEIAEWKVNDPIKRFRTYLLENKMQSESEIKEIEERAKKAMEDAVNFAENSPYPSIDTIMDDVYSGGLQ